MVHALVRHTGRQARNPWDRHRVRGARRFRCGRAVRSAMGRIQKASLSTHSFPSSNVTASEDWPRRDTNLRPCLASQHSKPTSPNSMMNATTQLIGSFLAVGSLLISGCGSNNRASVSGTVTLDGKTLESGVIAFLPTNGNQGPTAGAVISNGRYEIASARGPTFGAYRVTVSSMQKTGHKIPSLGGSLDEMAEVIPLQYRDDSKLVIDVQPGGNTFDLELKGRVPIEAIIRRYPTGPPASKQPEGETWKGPR